jgi:hypothetical protein
LIGSDAGQAESGYLIYTKVVWKKLVFKNSFGEYGSCSACCGDVHRSPGRFASFHEESLAGASRDPAGADVDEAGTSQGDTHAALSLE